jgi:hypothetical protein
MIADKAGSAGHEDCFHPADKEETLMNAVLGLLALSAVAGFIPRSLPLQWSPADIFNEIGWPSDRRIRSAGRRAIVLVGPPAAKGTMIVIGRDR